MLMILSGIKPNGLIFMIEKCQNGQMLRILLENIQAFCSMKAMKCDSCIKNLWSLIL